MDCIKYTLTNTSEKEVTFNYRECETTQFQNQVQLLPYQTKNVWLIEDSLQISNFFLDKISISRENNFCANCNPQYSWTQYNSTQCYSQTFSPIISSSNFPPALNAPNSDYSRYGTVFYKPGFALCGTGSTYTTATTVNVWANPSTSTSVGPLNRTGKWPSQSPNYAPPFDTWIGWSVCLTGTTLGKTYYLGVGADNAFKISLDGISILNTTADPRPWFGLDFGGTIPFVFWHVYPITVGAGSHVLEVQGLNREFRGVLGFEIYDTTIQQLTAATTLSSLRIIQSSTGKNRFEVGQTQNGAPITSGYTCPSGYQYSICTNNCVKTIFCNTNIPPTPSITPTKTQTPTPTPSITATKTQTPSVTPSNTQTPTMSPTNTNTQTMTPTATPTTTNTPSVTPSNTQTPTITPTNTQTPSVTPSNTQTPSVTPSNTQTPSETPTMTPTPSITPSTCVGYVLDAGGGSASIEWFDCGGSYLTQTFTGQYTICTDGSGYVVTVGSVMVISGPYPC